MKRRAAVAAATLCFAATAAVGAADDQAVQHHPSGGLKRGNAPHHCPQRLSALLQHQRDALYAHRGGEGGGSRLCAHARKQPAQELSACGALPQQHFNAQGVLCGVTPLRTLALLCPQGGGGLGSGGEWSCQAHHGLHLHSTGSSGSGFKFRQPHWQCGGGGLSAAPPPRCTIHLRAGQVG